MSIQPRMLYNLFLILIFTALSGCAARGKANPAGQSGEHRGTMASTEGDRNKTTSVPESSVALRRSEIEGSTLDDYLQFAALHNPDLEAAFNRWKASQEKALQVQSLPDPRLTYTYFITNVETRVGPQRHKIDLAQMFPWYGTRTLRGDLARKESDELWEKFESMKTSLFYKVRLTYFEYYYLSRSIDITKKNLELMTALEQSARIRYSSGKASYTDVIKAQVEIAKLEERLVGLNDLKNPLIADFNTLLNRAVGEQLPPPDSIPGYILSMPEDSLYVLMKEENPELREFGIRIDRETDRIDLAKKQFYPDLTVGLSYIETGEARMPGVSDSGKDPLMTMFTVNLPIWRDKYRATVREAEIGRKSAISSMTARENNLQAELNRSLYNYRDAERKIDLYTGVLIPKAQEALDVTTLAYVTGAVDFLNLLHAQSTLLDLELMYERMLSNRARSFAQLEMLVGKELTDENKQ